MIGHRLRRARAAAGLSMENLATQAGVSRNMIKKYEHNKNMPRSDTLLKLATALNVRTEYFFRPTDITLEEIKYRTCSNTPSNLLKQIKADVLEQAERWFELHDLWPNAPVKNFEYPLKSGHMIDSLEQIEEVAHQLRNAWSLSNCAIQNLVDVLESQGLLVIITTIDTNNRFDGLLGSIKKQPVIVVSEHGPGDRQRFTIAHELGHLILADRLHEDLDEEKACNRFAGAFLLPAPAIRQRLGTQRKKLELQELYLLKQEFGLSMQGCIHRAADLGIITDYHRQQLRRHFRAMDWRTKEPGPPYPKEQTHHFKQLVYRALAESILTESKAAELLAIDLMQFHQMRKMEPHGETINQ